MIRKDSKYDKGLLTGHQKLVLVTNVESEEFKMVKI
jgi:hypothetical protein